MHHKHYTSHGSRGKSVKQLNAQNVTEEERFIFEYLNRKRERQAALGLNGEHADVVDDDEFDAYLDSLGGKGKKGGVDDEEFDFMGDFGNDQSNRMDGEDEDWDDEDDDDDDDDNEGDQPMDDE